MILTDYAIKFRTAVVVLTLAIVVIGVVSYLTLPREGAPDITIPYVFVTATYEGTAISEMEKIVTVPIEKALGTVENVKEIRSTTGEGVSSISIEFMAGQDIDTARQKIKDKIDLARPDLPTDLDEPIVDAFNFSSDSPILMIALSGDVAAASLKGLAEDIQDQFEMLPGVKEADISGVREREIRVELDLGRLVGYGIPISLVMQRIAGENSTISAGNIEMRGSKFQVRVPGEFEEMAGMRDLLLVDRPEGAVYLRDVARVEDTFKDLSSISRLNGKPCVSLSVKKRSGENSVSLIRQLKKTLAAVRLPAGVASTIVFDESDYVAMMIAELENNIFSGFVLVVIVLLVAMGFRNSLFVGLAIPLSMLITFIFLALLGDSLNMIVLFSLVLAVGMLVDNAIVIVENIYRNHCEGMSRLEAARVGAAEVAWPVTTSTLTTLAAFAPLLFWPDIMGQFMSFLPRTLIASLTASLFVALIINPAFCSTFLRRGTIRPEGDVHPILRGYERLLRGALNHRVAVVVLGVVFLVLSTQLYSRYGRGVELFPETAPRNAVVSVKFPQGTGIERTDAAMRLIEAKLPKYGDIEFFLTTVGGGAGAMFSPVGGGGTHEGSIHVEFVEFEKRKEDSLALVNRIRDDIGLISGADVKVEREREGPPTGAPISLELSGDDFDTLGVFAQQIINTIETVPGLVDLQDDLEETLPELQFHVDRQRLALLGLDTDSVGFFLRTAVYGTETSKFRVDEDEFDITVRFRESDRNTVDALSRISIPVAGRAPVPLTSLGFVRYEGGRGIINRTDKKRVVTISGSNQDRGVDKILADIRARMEAVRLPRGYNIRYRGDNEEMVNSGAFLLKAFGIAVALIAVILVIQFNSTVLPSIVMFTVVLSLNGVMWGLLLCKQRFGVIMTGLGVISLAGVVVNNAIVLIDCMNQRKAEGLSWTEAIVSAGRLRLRPVLLTAITTVLGLIPMAVGWSVEIHSWPPRFVAGSETSAWWAPMAVSVIFGLSLATLLTLVLVPVMCSLAESAAWRVRTYLSRPG